MCGIAGIIGRLDSANRSALKRLNDALIHRGPDGEGVWESSADARGWGVLLGHRRLSILDLSPAGAQPMVDPVTGHVLVLNGEIYNYVELRNQLATSGQHFQSTGDSAVMLRALGLHGHKALNMFRGMFAFASWDPKRRKLTLARDPLGIKPLYLARNPDPQGDWSLVFASEVRAILASGLLGKRRLNPMATASMVWSGHMTSPATAVEGIESSWPGQVGIFNAEGAVELLEDYWTSTPRQRRGTNEKEFASALEESVRLHLASDVPLGIFLSGGVDSSSLANMANAAMDEPVHTFTLAFEEENYSESRYARSIAKAIGTRHQEFVLTEQFFVEHLEQALNSLDMPTFDGLNSYYMSKFMREAGFKVALTGTGGDELFGGYKSFRTIPNLLRLARYTKWISPRLRTEFARRLLSVVQPQNGEFPRQIGWAKFPEVTRCGSNLLRLYQMAYALFLPKSQQLLLNDAVHGALVDGLQDPMRSRLDLFLESKSTLSAISGLEVRLYLGERLLRDTDATSMAQSLEVRLPLVDHVLCDSINGLPDRLRFNPLGKKSLLRRIGLRGLNPALFERPKRGFVMPFHPWIKKGLGKVVHQTMCDPVLVKPTGLNPQAVKQLWMSFQNGAPGIYWTRVWAIFVLIRWCHMQKVYI